MKIIILIVCPIILIFCSTTENALNMEKNFRSDIDFLKSHSDAIVLANQGGSGQIIVVPAYQGRVMTSTLDGENGAGFGWINYDKIEEGQMDERFNAYGGEDRFWLGPEGGQFSLYHKPESGFTLDNWYVPKQFDALPFQVVERGDQDITMETSFTIHNYSNTKFDVKVIRKVRIFENDEIQRLLEIDNLNSLKVVGFESQNRLINIGDTVWNKEKGLLSIWILGMYNPGKEVVIILPYYQGGVGSLGEVVNDNYFGEVPPDRLRVGGGVVYFKGDGTYRSKIGLNWMRAKDILGSYDPDKNVLTIVKYSKAEEKADYIRSMWEIMNNPYDGDVVNSYNDGPPEPGTAPMGPFYELETSSPVKPLRPGEEILHVHQTYHIQGTEKQLNILTEELFNVKIQQVKDAFVH